VYVADASAIVSYILGDDHAAWVAQSLEGQVLLHAPSLVDYEVTSALRRVGNRRRALQALDDLALIRLLRHAARPLLPRVWALRDRVSAYDAAYVALAEALELPLLTLDRRLARAAGDLVPIIAP
jgi:predicted nucleic acid-binding protein